MVEVDADRSYLVDYFEVEGGRQHDYSLHGPPGDFTLTGGDWTEPARGTLAGEDVAVGALYDDPALAAPENKGRLHDLRRLGFSASGQRPPASLRTMGGGLYA